MAQSNGSFGIVITAVDKASSTLNTINKNLAKMNAPVDKLTAEFKKFGNLSGINSFAKGIGNFEKSITSAIGSVGKFVPMLGALTGAASVAGFYRLTEATIEWATHLKITADLLGINTTQLQNFRNAATLAGSSANDMDQGLAGVQKTLLDIDWRQGNWETTLPILQKGLQGVGSSLYDIKGHLKSASELMPDIAEWLSKIQDPAKRGAAEDMLGLPRSLDAILKKGRKGWEDYNKAAAKFALPQATIDKLDQMREKFSNLTVSVDSLSKSIVADFSPQITKALDGLQKWFNDPNNKKSIEDFITDIGKDIDIVATDFGKVVDAIDPIVKSLGGWKALGEDILLIFGAKMLLNFTLLSARLLPLTLAITAAIDAYNKMKNGLDMSSLPTDSPLWRDVPVDEQLKYPNSPASQGRSNPTQDPWSPSGIWNRIFGSSSDKPTTTTASGPGSMSAEERGVLDAISGGEANSHGYSTQNPHSSAHGRYQFMPDTVADLFRKMNIAPGTQITDEMQDQMALRLMRDAGWRPGMSPEQTAGILNKIWPSLPGGSQQNQSMEQFRQRMERGQAAEQARDHIAAPNGVPPTGPAFGPQPTVSPPTPTPMVPVNPSINGQQTSQIDMNIHVSHDQPGTRVGISHTGTALASAPRIAYTGPNFGVPA